MNQTCPQHAQSLLTFCIDEKCTQSPFACSECSKSHQCPKLEIITGVEEFTKKLRIETSLYENIAQHFNKLEQEQFNQFIKQQKLKITDDITLLKKQLNSKIEQLEIKLLEQMDEQITIYSKNVQTLKAELKETDKFKQLVKSSDQNRLMLKLSSNQDPNLIIKKLKQELIHYNNYIESGKPQILQEYFLLLQSQSVNPPTYRSVEFQTNEYSSLVAQFDQYLISIDQAVKQYLKQYPLTDFQSKNASNKILKKQTKVIDEENCITTMEFINDYIIYAMSDLTIKIRNNQLKELDSIQLEIQTHCCVEVFDNINVPENAQPIGKHNYIQVGQVSFALGCDGAIQLYSVQSNSLFLVKELKHAQLSRCISLLNTNKQLIAGDWDGQLLSFDLPTYRILFVIDTYTSILFQIVKSTNYLITGSKCDMEQGGIIFWKLSAIDCYQEKRLKVTQVQKMQLSDEVLYLVDNKLKLQLYDTNKMQLLRQFFCGESYVNDLAVFNNQIFVLNQMCLKIISVEGTNYQHFEDFPCSQCRSYFQSNRLVVKDGRILFARHLHQCKHEAGDEDKCSMKSNVYLLV